MARFAVSAVFIFALAALTYEVDGQTVFSYNVNVNLASTSKFADSQEGKLKITFKSGNTAHKVALSAE